MRKIEFTNVSGSLKVRLDGELLHRVALDTGPIKMAKKARVWTPKTEEDYFKQVQKRMTDEGVTAPEANIIMARFKAEIIDL